MTLVSMNIKDDDSSMVTASGDYDPSPCLYLTAAQCEALGISTPPAAGSQVTLRGVALVESVTQSVDGDEDDPDVRMTLCVTHLELSGAPASASSDAASSLYGGTND